MSPLATSISGHFAWSRRIKNGKDGQTALLLLRELNERLADGAPRDRRERRRLLEDARKIAEAGSVVDKATFSHLVAFFELLENDPAANAYRSFGKTIGTFGIFVNGPLGVGLSVGGLALEHGAPVLSAMNPDPAMMIDDYSAIEHLRNLAFDASMRSAETWPEEIQIDFHPPEPEVRIVIEELPPATRELLISVQGGEAEITYEMTLEPVEIAVDRLASAAIEDPDKLRNELTGGAVVAATILEHVFDDPLAASVVKRLAREVVKVSRISELLANGKIGTLGVVGMGLEFIGGLIGLAGLAQPSKLEQMIERSHEMLEALLTGLERTAKLLDQRTRQILDLQRTTLIGLLRFEGRAMEALDNLRSEMRKHVGVRAEEQRENKISEAIAWIEQLQLYDPRSDTALPLLTPLAGLKVHGTMVAANKAMTGDPANPLEIEVAHRPSADLLMSHVPGVLHWLASRREVERQTSMLEAPKLPAGARIVHPAEWMRASQGYAQAAAMVQGPGLREKSVRDDLEQLYRRGVTLLQASAEATKPDALFAACIAFRSHVDDDLQTFTASMDQRLLDFGLVDWSPGGSTGIFGLQEGQVAYAFPGVGGIGFGLAHLEKLVENDPLAIGVSERLFTLEKADGGPRLKVRERREGIISPSTVRFVRLKISVHANVDVAAAERLRAGFLVEHRYRSGGLLRTWYDAQGRELSARELLDDCREVLWQDRFRSKRASIVKEVEAAWERIEVARRSSRDPDPTHSLCLLHALRLARVLGAHQTQGGFWEESSPYYLALSNAPAHAARRLIGKELKKSAERDIQPFGSYRGGWFSPITYSLELRMLRLLGPSVDLACDDASASPLPELHEALRTLRMALKLEGGSVERIVAENRKPREPDENALDEPAEAIDAVMSALPPDLIAVLDEIFADYTHEDSADESKMEALFEEFKSRVSDGDLERVMAEPNIAAVLRRHKIDRLDHYGLFAFALCERDPSVLGPIDDQPEPEPLSAQQAARAARAFHAILAASAEAAGTPALATEHAAALGYPTRDGHSGAFIGSRKFASDTHAMRFVALVRFVWDVEEARRLDDVPPSEVKLNRDGQRVDLRFTVWRRPT